MTRTRERGSKISKFVGSRAEKRTLAPRLPPELCDRKDEAPEPRAWPRRLRRTLRSGAALRRSAPHSPARPSPPRSSRDSERAVPPAMMLTLPSPSVAARPAALRGPRDPRRATARASAVLPASARVRATTPPRAARAHPPRVLRPPPRLAPRRPPRGDDASRRVARPVRGRGAPLREDRG